MKLILMILCGIVAATVLFKILTGLIKLIAIVAIIGCIAWVYFKFIK